MKFKSLAVLSLSMSLMLVGCGNKEVQENMEDDKLVVGMECTYAPFNWQTTKPTDTSVSLGGAGYADGYDVRMARYIAEELGKEVEVKKIGWNGLEPALNSGDIDVAIAGITATETRKTGMDFTTPYYESEMVMIVRKDDQDVVKYHDIQQFKGKKIVGQKNTSYDLVIDQIQGVKHATPKDAYPDMVIALKSHDVDGITAELPVAQGVVKANDDLAIVHFDEDKGFDIDTSVSIAMKKGSSDEALFKDIQAALDRLPQETRLQWMEECVAISSEGE